MTLQVPPTKLPASFLSRLGRCLGLIDLAVTPLIILLLPLAARAIGPGYLLLPYLALALAALAAAIVALILRKKGQRFFPAILAIVCSALAILCAFALILALGRLGFPPCNFLSLHPQSEMVHH